MSRDASTQTCLTSWGGMKISQGKGNEDSLISILEGELSDQAALAGVINSLYELHLPILLIRRMDV